MFTGWPGPRSFLQKQQQAWSGEPGWAVPNLHMRQRDRRADLCLMVSFALYTVGAATSARAGDRSSLSTGAAALQQQLKLWAACGDKPVLRGTVPLLSWGGGATGTKGAGPGLGPAGQHRLAVT